MIKKRISDVIATVLMIYFLHSAISNFVNINNLKEVLAFYTRGFRSVAWLIFFAQTAISIALFIQKTRFYGQIGAFVCLAGLTLTIFKHPRFPHDFGGILNYLNTKEIYLFLISCILLSIVSIVLTLKYTRTKKETPDLSVPVYH